MTNNEKLGQIRKYIDDVTYDAVVNADRDDLHSAKWIYRKGQSDMAARVRDAIINILSQK